MRGALTAQARAAGGAEAPSTTTVTTSPHRREQFSTVARDADAHQIQHHFAVNGSAGDISSTSFLMCSPPERTRHDDSCIHSPCRAFVSYDMRQVTPITTGVEASRTIPMSPDAGIAGPARALALPRRRRAAQDAALHASTVARWIALLRLSRFPRGAFCRGSTIPRAVLVDDLPAALFIAAALLRDAFLLHSLCLPPFHQLLPAASHEPSPWRKDF